MASKSPRRIRQDLNAAHKRTSLLIEVLTRTGDERQWGPAIECTKASQRLRQLLDENKIPEEYKVAVIRRFKAGKPSFVNEPLGCRLAGEDTNSETAASTTSWHAERVFAKSREKVVPHLSLASSN